jgi:hypothetical protein
MRLALVTLPEALLALLGAIVTRRAEGLPIGAVPEEAHVTTVRSDVIHHQS